MLLFGFMKRYFILVKCEKNFLHSNTCKVSYTPFFQESELFVEAIDLTSQGNAALFLAKNIKTNKKEIYLLKIPDTLNQEQGLNILIFH
jgi:hypothetical protein